MATSSEIVARPLVCYSTIKRRSVLLYVLGGFTLKLQISVDLDTGGSHKPLHHVPLTSRHCAHQPSNVTTISIPEVEIPPQSAMGFHFLDLPSKARKEKLIGIEGFGQCHGAEH
eukprot:COSAG02_NODE_4218_length_5619_cov_1.862138_2_plen_114_part_00